MHYFLKLTSKTHLKEAITRTGKGHSTRTAHQIHIDLTESALTLTAVSCKADLLPVTHAEEELSLREKGLEVRSGARRKGKFDISGGNIIS